MKYIKIILAFVIPLIIWYLVFSFILANFTILEWSIFARLLYFIISMVAINEYIKHFDI